MVNQREFCFVCLNKDFLLPSSLPLVIKVSSYLLVHGRFHMGDFLFSGRSRGGSKCLSCTGYFLRNFN